jgi:hypothetical protein
MIYPGLDIGPFVSGNHCGFISGGLVPFFVHLGHTQPVFQFFHDSKRIIEQLCKRIGVLQE